MSSSLPPDPSYSAGYGSSSWPVPSAPPGEASLDQPAYGIGPVDAVKRALRKYATFSGRASRSEFWWWTLFLNLALLVLAGLTAGVGVATSPDGGDTPGAAGLVLVALLVLFALSVVVPQIAVTVRRLHDAGYSGWLYLLSLIPWVGGLILLVLAALPTSPAGARFDKGAYGGAQAYGQDPYGYPPYGQDPYGQSQYHQGQYHQGQYDQGQYDQGHDVQNPSGYSPETSGPDRYRQSSPQEYGQGPYRQGSYGQPSYEQGGYGQGPETSYGQPQPWGPVDPSGPGSTDRRDA